MGSIKLNKMFWIFIVSAATALLALFSGFLQYRESIEQKEEEVKKANELSDAYKKLSQKNEEINKKSDSIILLQEKSKEEFTAKSNEIIVLQAKLNEKNELLIKQQKENLNFVTGGDSYCQSVLQILDAHTAWLSFMHHGLYPLYDLSARVVDVNFFSANIDKTNVDNLFEGELYFNLGNLSPSKIKEQSEGIGPFKIKGDFYKQMVSINIFYSSRNMRFTEELQMYSDGKQRFRAVRISTVDKVLMEKIDKGFPERIVGWRKK